MLKSPDLLDKTTVYQFSGSDGTWNLVVCKVVVATPRQSVGGRRQAEFESAACDLDPQQPTVYATVATLRFVADKPLEHGPLRLVKNLEIELFRSFRRFVDRPSTGVKYELTSGNRIAVVCE